MVKSRSEIDGGLRKHFRGNLREGFHWTTVENGFTSPGTPDSNFAADGVERWIEFKFTSAFAVSFRPGQVGWHKARAERGGVSFIAVRRRHEGGSRKGSPVDELWIYLGSDADVLDLHGVACDQIVPVCRQFGGLRSWDWRVVRAALVAPY